MLAALLGIVFAFILLTLAVTFMRLKNRSILEISLFTVVFVFMYSIALMEQALTKLYTGLISASVVYLVYYLGFKKELDEKTFFKERDMKFFEKNIIKISDYLSYLFEDFKDEDYNIWIHNFHQIERYVTEIKSYECKDERVNDFKKELLERIFNPIINSISRYRENQIRNDKVYKAFLKRVAGLINNEFNHIFHGEYSEIGKDLLKAVSKDSAKIAK